MARSLLVAAPLLAALWFGPSGPVRADDGTISAELNKLEQKEAACHATIVLRNGAGAAFRSLKLDLVIFGSDGIVSKRLALETAPLPAGKTSVKVFDIAGQPCDGIGSILLNGVLECADESGRQPDCLNLVETGSRASASFIK